MEIKNLYYQHEKGAPYFFKNLSFFLEPGKIHALHGKNGTGKTVLLQILNQTVPSKAIVNGNMTDKNQVFLVNQRFDQMIADHFSFEKNLQFCSMQKKPSCFNKPKTSFLPEFLETFQIDVKRPLCELSGGQRQILALVMALKQKTKILLLDEPTAALDEENASLVFAFLKTLMEQEMTLLVVCHDQDLIQTHATGTHFTLEKLSTGERVMNQF